MTHHGWQVTQLILSFLPLRRDPDRNDRLNDFPNAH